MMVLTVRYGKNGIANCVMNYISRLDPARVRCDLVCPNEPGNEARALVGQTGGQVFVLGGRNRHPLSYIRKLAALVREREIEILHAHGNSATLAADNPAACRKRRRDRPSFVSITPHPLTITAEDADDAEGQ